MNLVIVGSVAFDAIETPFGKTGKILGGAGTFVSLSASYFNENCKLISVVGGDFPEEHFKMLNAHKIDTEGIQIIKEGKTFFWSGKYFNDMNSRETLITELNVLGTFDPVVPKSYQGAEVLMLGNLSPVVQRKVIEQMEVRPKFIVMDTMNFWMNIMLDELKTTLKMVDLLSINDEEARQLSGELNLVKAARKILEMGPKYLIIKKGEHGAMLFDKQNIFAVPALPLEQVFDPTGAGDTFAGGFVGYLSRSSEITFDILKNAIVAGSIMASFCVEQFGTQNLVNLDKKQISERIDKFVSILKFDADLSSKI